MTKHRRGTEPGWGGFPKTGLFACVSRDHGQTWDTEHQVMLRDGNGGQVNGYPSAVPLRDGSVYAVYCQAPNVYGIRFHPRFGVFGSSEE